LLPGDGVGEQGWQVKVVVGAHLGAAHGRSRSQSTQGSRGDPADWVAGPLASSARRITVAQLRVVARTPKRRSKKELVSTLSL
jgi:hypothetical protein